MRGVGLEEEEAEGTVGECAIGIVGVVPVLEGGEVPVDAADQGVAAVVACGEGQELADIDKAHGDGMLMRE